MKTTSALLAILCSSTVATATKNNFDESKYCPGSPATRHARCAMTVSFPSNTCNQVKLEMISRMTNADWIDPHNRGKYTLHDANDNGDDMSFIRGSRITGNGQYTDKFMLTFNPGESDDSCQLVACSQSQVFSVLDYSTNYCNLRNLYCSEGDGCVNANAVENTDLAGYVEEYVDCNQNAKRKCIVSSR
mmetsp:Transcript_21063/g.37795  ORF Transcript_21063/g.37795 Transcript_21063/m.37795 type:complete len:189 (-) Transcript_21063:121-687(-)|eukprot:CAMPEP_0201608728 /NCGR_PEP_ID=MMETSP0492-20130828/8702_1 /ASSEMBLY_ACC=CAM_ASM_000837 /TAXON_ID=420259 /ORGANISM="Thalassiosira gravida, Strain GMp14c1" /LENGTH=188 /DNA_ID=CAMNT_0048073675 /DNA_START=67 /DNA_END=633 /DNA_ORIENTATION=-